MAEPAWLFEILRGMMVSYIQFGVSLALQEDGWYPVSSAAPFEREHTPVGGPAVMMNSKHEFIAVFADGSVAALGPVKVVTGARDSVAAKRVEGSEPVRSTK